jgi:hypothetical protein
MGLTKEQKQNLHQLDTDTCVEILHECAERLGLVDVSTYCEVMGRKKRSVYYAIEEGRIPCIEIGKQKLLIINSYGNKNLSTNQKRKSRLH